MNLESLLVAELFGPTFQGEGPSSGQRAAFVRLSRCNLTCSWCDTPYTWDTRRYDLRRESRRMPVQEVINLLEGIPADLIVVTGGEPLLQQRALLPLVATCHSWGRSVEIETNGIVDPLASLVPFVTRFNVSPKLANSELPLARRIDPGTLRALTETGKALFKFVVKEPAELDEVAHLETRFGLAPIWIMPEGRTSDAVLRRMRELADEVIARGWNLTTRLHVLLWEDSRGR